MNCERATELLPWYLNNTLDATESREVREHLASCEGCRKALDDTRRAWTIFDQHIPSEALVALAWGEEPEGYLPGSPGFRETLEAHLQSCPECAAELELVRMSRRLEEDDRIAVFSKPAQAPEKQLRQARPQGNWRAAALAAGLTCIVAGGGWIWSAGQAEDMRSRLASVSAAPEPTAAGTTGAPAPVPPSAPPAPPSPSGAGSESDRLASLAAEIDRLRQSEADMRRQTTEMQDQLSRIVAGPTPQVNLAIADLRPTADVVRGGTAEPTILPAGTVSAAILQPAHAETHKDHRIEAVDAAGKVVWSAEGLRRSAQGDFPVLLPALKPGAYTLRIAAQEAGKRVELETYEVQVR